jgi:hypothetical protein
MLTNNAGPPANQDRYRIVAQGEFGELLCTAFRDASIEVCSGTTELVIQVADNQELYGMVDRLRDHAVTIISLRRED